MIKTILFILNHPLNRHCRLRAIYIYFWWQFKCRFNGGKPITFDWINGAKILVHRSETGVTGNLYCGLHEFNDMAFLLHVLRPGDLFLDIGANSGSYTVLASGVCGSRTIAMEPIPDSFKRLTDNIKINNISNLVNSICGGAGELPRRLMFTSDQDTVNHVVLDNIYPNSVSAQIHRLDDIVKNVKPILIKIDVEGFEYHVLKGAEDIINSECPMAFLLELNGSGKRYGISDDMVSEILLNAKFEIYDYDPVHRKLQSRKTARNSGNTLFIRNLTFFIDRIENGKKFIVHKMTI